MKSTFPSLLVFAVLVAGCTGGSQPEYVNPSIAESYGRFYSLGVSQPAEAKKAIEEAEKADPKNSYTRYLMASAEAQTKNFETALRYLEEGNLRERSLIYVTAPPPEDSMQTLTRLRQMSATAANPEAEKQLKERLPEYWVALRTMGSRVAKSEPVCSLSVLNGAGIVRRVLQSEVDHYTKIKDEAKLAAAKKQLDEVAEWYSELSKNLADTLKDIMREAGKAAGLTDEELDIYARGMDLKDKGKQAKAEEARQKIYAAEVEVLRNGLAKMPDVTK